MEESRTQLRTAAQRRRAAADPDACRIWSQTIQARIFEHPAYLSARCIAVYCAIGNEVETAAIIDNSLRHAKRVLIPGPMEQKPGFREISQAWCSPGHDSWISASDLRAVGPGLVIIVPGVLFDCHGRRLGRGGGWYDRALDALQGKGVYIGLAYEFQIVSRVPAEPWDQRVHFIVTEARVIDCGIQPLVGVTEKC